MPRGWTEKDLARRSGTVCPSKYRNQKTVVDGIKFDSKKEAQAYQQLKIMEMSGDISYLQLQPRFEVTPGMRTPDGKWQRPICYVADFRFFRHSRPGSIHGETVVVDVKGKKTDVYRLKLKLFRKAFPELTFEEW